MKRITPLIVLALSTSAQARECKVWAVVACYPDSSPHRETALEVRSEWNAKVVEFSPNVVCVAEGPYRVEAQAQKKVSEHRRYLSGLKASGALTAAYIKRDCK
jgi:hypothetical protein